MDKVEMKLGNKRIITEVCCEQICAKCGEPAKYKHTYLLYDCRENPASSAYGRNDCSWCSDEEIFACEKHKDLAERAYCPRGMSWCATFTRNEKSEHIFLYWEKISVEQDNK